jgi:phospholipase/carboxylesterase
MSDGGTFSYVSGLRSDAPFTHLAPSSASFHPMLVETVDPARVKDLPIYIMHGALDWMFPVDVARTARDTFTAHGAQVEYREIDDLSHTYPTEENPRIMHWMMGD